MADAERNRNHPASMDARQRPADENPPQARSETDPRRGPSPRTPGEAFEANSIARSPAAPEDTNYAHPGTVGARKTVPGAGIVGADANAGPAEGGGGGGGDYPGRSTGPAPLLAPGAERPGTTDRGPWAPAQGQARDALNDLSADPEAPTASGNVALNPGVEGVPGPNADVGAAPELADPNYSAASSRRWTAAPDAGVTRMDTGSSGDFSQGQPPHHDRNACRVGDVMTADVAVCSADTEVYYVARMMAERDVGAIPVVESTDTMKPVGVVTDRDIALRVVAKNQDPKGLRATDVMSADVLTVTPDTSLEDCLSQMEQKQVRRVVVVDGSGRVCGIVAQADVARHGPRKQAGELVKEVSQPDKPGAKGQYH